MKRLPPALVRPRAGCRTRARSQPRRGGSLLATRASGWDREPPYHPAAFASVRTGTRATHLAVQRSMDHRLFLAHRSVARVPVLTDAGLRSRTRPRNHPLAQVASRPPPLRGLGGVKKGTFNFLLDGFVIGGLVRSDASHRTYPRNALWNAPMTSVYRLPPGVGILPLPPRPSSEAFTKAEHLLFLPTVPEAAVPGAKPKRRKK